MVAAVTLATISVLLNETTSAGRPAGPVMVIVPVPPCPALLLVILTGAAPVRGLPSGPTLLRKVPTSKVISPAFPVPVVEAVMVDPLLRLAVSA